MSVAYNALNLANKTANVVNQMSNLINSEEKSFGLANSLSVLSSGHVIPINAIPQGDTGVTRNGIRVLMKNIYIKFYITNDAESTIPDPITRVSLVYDKEAGASSYNDLYVASVLGMKNLDNTERFVVLSDNTYKLTDMGYDASTNVITIFKKLNCHVDFDDDNSTTITTGGLYLYVITNSTDATHHPTFFYQTKLTYYDN